MMRHNTSAWLISAAFGAACLFALSSSPASAAEDTYSRATRNSLRARRAGRLNLIAACEHGLEPRAVRLEEIAGQFGDGSVFEEQRLGERAERALEMRRQADGENRVDPVVLQRRLRIDLVRLKADDLRALVAQKLPGLLRRDAQFCAVVDVVGDLIKLLPQGLNYRGNVISSIDAAWHELSQVAGCQGILSRGMRTRQGPQVRVVRQIKTTKRLSFKLLEDSHGKEWVLFGNPLPALRCPATFESWQDPSTWQILEPQEGLPCTLDGRRVRPHSGSIAWNSFRKRYVTVFMESFGKPSAFGELWYAEAKNPMGPWGTAVKILSHENYTFYNPRLHPEITPADSPILIFEGTYTAEFAGRPPPTPRYNYNQILYRLDLADPRLAEVKAGK